MTAHVMRIATVTLMAFVLAACTHEQDTASVAEAYLRSIVADDVERLAELPCAEHEATAIAAATSFRGTDAELRDMLCRVDEANEDYNIVACQGKIVVSYQAELREFPLGRYRVIRDNDVWRVCGEA